MKAWVLHGINDIRLENISQPQIKENEVLVRVKACGVCGSDIPRIYKDGAHKMPLVPGHEFSGEVVEVGSTEYESWLQKPVGIYPLIPCGTCIACQKGTHEMCRQYSYLGSRRDGGFAEYVAVPAKNLIELPQNVTFAQAAMLEPMAVAVHAMRRLSINQTDVVVVCGLGTIGQLLVMFLLEKGVQNILAIGNKDLQKKTVLALGLPEENICDSRQQNVEEWLWAHTNETGPDIFFECVGRNETIAQAIDLTAPGGKVRLIGNPYADMVLEKAVYWKILRNQLYVTGTWNSSFFAGVDEEHSDWQYVLNRLEEGKIQPEQIITHSMPMENLEKGFHIMRDKSEEYLKVMTIL